MKNTPFQNYLSNLEKAVSILGLSKEESDILRKPANTIEKKLKLILKKEKKNLTRTEYSLIMRVVHTKGVFVFMKMRI